jgi:sensor histidine kinase YesM
MAVTAGSIKSRRVPALLNGPRVLLAVAVPAAFGAAFGVLAGAPAVYVTVVHAVAMGIVVTLAFGLLERYPTSLPARVPRWIVQLVGVVVAVPIGVLLPHLVHMAVSLNAAHEQAQLLSLGYLVFASLLLAPWIALGAMVRQRDLFVRDQALKFELERSELERDALDARLRLLQAQVEPHFLFNTLANVQALVDAGSPQARGVLASLIAYLRAAVPRMHEPATTLGQELELVRAYLELMKMRMPDRLDFALTAAAGASAQQCPPMAVLTLVENAVRHGIDPSEEGGRIDIDVRIDAGRCVVRVTDTGVGLAAAGKGLGTGLATLEERLALAFGGAAHLRVAVLDPHGVRAEIDMPAQAAAQ